MPDKKKSKNTTQSKNSIIEVQKTEDLSLKDSLSPTEKESFLKKNAVALASAFISLCALFFTIWQSWKIREHNRLSVTPKIQITWLRSTNNDFDIKFKNTGVGPVVFDEIILKTKNDKSYSSKSLSGSFWNTVFKDANFPDSTVYGHLSNFILAPGQFLAVKDEVPFFGIMAKGLSLSEYNKTITFFSQSSIYVFYHSIYNENFKDSLVFGEFKSIVLPNLPN